MAKLRLPFRKKVLCRFGLGLSFLSIIFAILVLVFDVQTYPFTNQTWTNHGWYRRIGKIQVSLVVLTLVFGVCNVNAFTWGTNCKTYEQYFFFVSIAGFLIMLILTTLCFTAASIGKNSKKTSCQEEFDGLFYYFNNLQPFIDQASSLFCSKECPCDNDNILSFVDCNDDVKNKALEVNEFSFKGKFDLDKFASYFKKVEKKYKCTGWCTTNSNSDLHYLFYDSKDIPEVNGCANKMTGDVQKKLNIFSVFALLFCVSLLIIAFLDLVNWKDLHKDGPNVPENWGWGWGCDRKVVRAQNENDNNQMDHSEKGASDVNINKNNDSNTDPNVEVVAKN